MVTFGHAGRVTDRDRFLSKITVRFSQIVRIKLWLWEKLLGSNPKSVYDRKYHHCTILSNCFAHNKRDFQEMKNKFSRNLILEKVQWRRCWYSWWFDVQKVCLCWKIRKCDSQKVVLRFCVVELCWLRELSRIMMKHFCEKFIEKRGFLRLPVNRFRALKMGQPKPILTYFRWLMVRKPSLKRGGVPILRHIAL